MNKPSTDYRLASFMLGSFMLVFSGCLALGVVWMRQSNTTAARRVQQVERELEVAKRKLYYIQDKYAEAHNPETLARMAGQVLVVPSSKQIVWITPANRTPAAESPSNRTPYAVSYELALLDSTKKP